MLWLFVSLSLGALFARLAPSEWPLGRVADRALNAGLLVLLAMMGVRMGASDRVVTDLGSIGVRAAALAVGGIAGSVVLVVAAGRFLPAFDDAADAGAAGDAGSLPTLVLGALLFGGVVGRFVAPPGVVDAVVGSTDAALYVVLFAVGVTVATGADVLSSARRLGPSVLLLPVCVAVGSVAGTVLVGVGLGVPSHDAAAVGAGFGWYSLSGVLASEVHGVYLGSLTFLANVLRELLTFVSLPFLVRYFGGSAGVASGGATSMDVTLPAIRRVAGRDAVVPAIVSGAVLSLLVPVLVPAFLR